MKIIIANGKQVFVDDEDYEYLSEMNWTTTKGGYASMTLQNNYVRTSFLMHRLIMKQPTNKQIDHIDGNRLNNQKSNLRLATNAQNQMNRKKGSGCYSIYKGVCFMKHWKLKKPWCAYIKFNGKRKHLGCFKTQKEAALAYNQAASSLFKEYAKLNPI